jgi:hypothetical protein
VRRSWFESGDPSDRMRELLEHLRERGPLWWAELPALRRAAMEDRVGRFGGRGPVGEVDLGARSCKVRGGPPRGSGMGAGGGGWGGGAGRGGGGGGGGGGVGGGRGGVVGGWGGGVGAGGGWFGGVVFLGGVGGERYGGVCV